MTELELARALRLLGALFLVAPALYLVLRSRREALRNLTIWVVIAVVIGVLYLAFGET